LFVVYLLPTTLVACVEQLVWCVCLDSSY